MAHNNVEGARPGPLAPYRVLDLGGESAMYCGKLLGDLGADVIIVEPPGGHPARAMGPFYKDEPHPERSLFWFTFNTSKRSITLDVETPDGQDLLRRLGTSAHFLVESFPVGHLDSLGLSYRQLSAVNPALIMVSVTPFGQTGPYSRWQTSDLVSQAMGGIAFICGDAARAPVQVGGLQAYFQGGLQAAAGCLIAHQYRWETGEGQYIDLSLQHAVAGGLGIGGPHQNWDLNHVVYQRVGIPFDQGPVFGVSSRHPVVVECQDGYIAVSPHRCPLEPLLDWMASDGPDQWGHLKERKWSADALDFLSREDRELLDPLLADFVRRKPKAEVYAQAIKRRLPWSPLQSTDDLLADPHLASRAFFIEVEHPELGVSSPYAGPPANLSESPWRIQRRAPLIGEHNEQVYIEEMGLSRQTLARLKAGGVV